MKQTLVIMGFVILLQAVFCSTTVHSASEPEIMAMQDILIKSEVETAVSMLEAIHAKHQREGIGMEQSKKLAAELLRELRYGKDGYFWADTLEGINVVLYGRKDVEGKNRLEAQDPHGTYYIKEFLTKAKAGGGYAEYWFPKRGEAEYLPKRSYVLLFEPFGWVVGTGYYR